MSGCTLLRFRGTIATTLAAAAALSACTIVEKDGSDNGSGGTQPIAGTTGGAPASNALGNAGRADVLASAGGPSSVPVAGAGAVIGNGGSTSSMGGSGGAISTGAVAGSFGIAGRPVTVGGNAAVGAAGNTAVGVAGSAAVPAGGSAGAGGGTTVTVDCNTPTAAGPAGAIVSTVTGGLWNDATTWVGGKVPASTDNVVIAGEVQVDQGAANSTVTCASLTITKDGVVRSAAYAARTLLVTGDFVNYGAVRNGPPYASYDSATLEVHLGGRFIQMGSYGVVSTHFVGKQDQAIAAADGTALTGAFVDDEPTTALRACSPISSGGMTLTLGTSDAQRGTLDMGNQTLTLSAGDLKIVNGVLRASKIVGVAGATLNSDRISAVGTLTLDGDVRTDATIIDGSVKVLTKGVLYNVANATPTVVIKGSLETAGIVRRGPGYAAYGEGDMTVELSGDLIQNGVYAPTATKLTGSAVQTITQSTGQSFGGPFTDTTPATAIVAGSDLTFTATTFELGGGTLDMGSKTLNLSAGDFKVTNGTVRASKIVGVVGATLNIPQITAATPLVLDGDIRTDASVINGSIKVLATGVLYNVANAAPILTIKGNIDNAGTIRRGPGYAAYGEGDLTIDLSGNLMQNGPYTPTATKLSGTTSQTITLGTSQTLSGSFTDMTPATPIVAGSNWTVGGATFDLGASGILDMGSYTLTHPSGELKIATGTLKADDITGDSAGASTFTIPAITPNSGTLTVRQHYPTSSVTITGNLVIATGAHVYNEANVEARIAVTGTVTQNGTIGSGPGYASYDSGVVYLNGAKLGPW